MHKSKLLLSILHKYIKSIKAKSKNKCQQMICLEEWINKNVMIFKILFKYIYSNCQLFTLSVFFLFCPLTILVWLKICMFALLN